MAPTESGRVVDGPARGVALRGCFVAGPVRDLKTAALGVIQSPVGPGCWTDEIRRGYTIGATRPLARRAARPPSSMHPDCRSPVEASVDTEAGVSVVFGEKQPSARERQQDCRSAANAGAGAPSC
jgi:hypothetical protein